MLETTIRRKVIPCLETPELLKRAAWLGKPTRAAHEVQGAIRDNRNAAKGPVMRTMRIVALVLLLCGAGVQARAEDQASPEALAAAKDLMAVISPDMMKQLATSISATFWPAVEQKAKADKIDDATIGELRTEFERIQVAFASDAMKEAPPIYARHFTVDELKELTVFYRNGRQGASGSSAGNGRADRASVTAPAGCTAANRRSLHPNPAGSRLHEMKSK